jgi:EpsI family protein
VLLFLSAVPITVLMNSVRIALAGIGAERYGVAAAEGVLHAFEGVVVFLGCIVLLVGEMALLSRWSPRLLCARTTAAAKPADSDAGVAIEAPAARRPDGASPAVRPGSTLSWLVLVLCLAAAAAEVAPRPRHEIPDRTPFASLPLDLGEYRGRWRTIDEPVRAVLAADDLLLADFTDGEGRLLNLYTQYYQRQDRGAATHSPRLCIPAAGWEIADLRGHRVEAARFDGAALAVNRAVVTRDGARILVYYWFQQRGRNTTDEYLTKLFILRDGLLRHRTDGAMVRLITPLAEGEGEASGDARLERFATRLLPHLERHIPS